jgi:glutamate dehydrogenase (NADP+)
VRRARIEASVEEHPQAQFVAGRTLWDAPCQVASEAAALIKGSCIIVVESANVPVSSDAIHTFIEAGVRHAPGKAANAGGVTASALEMQQNATA